MITRALLPRALAPTSAFLLCLLAVAACGAATAPPSEPPAPGQADVGVEVDARRSLGTVEPRLFGVNIDFNWNANGLLSEDGRPFPAALAALRALRPTSVRGPGGSFSNTYDWKVGTGGGRAGYAAEHGFGTPEFLSLLRELGAEGLLTANFGTGDPQMMAAWMREIAKSGGRVATWEIGNEIYGNWEKGHTEASKYARRFLEFASAARATQPDARLALVVAPTLAGGGQDYERWNETVLPIAGQEADVASVHLYSPWHDFFGKAGRDTSVAVMAAADFWERELRRLHEALATVKGPKGRPPEIWVTEWNTMHGTDHDWQQRNVTAEQMVLAADLLRVFVETDVEVAQYYNAFGPYWGLFDRQGATDDLRSIQRLRIPPKRRPEDFRLVRRPAAHVFDLYGPLRGGERVAHEVKGTPTFATRKYGSIPAMSGLPALRALAVREKGGDGLSVMLVNRSLDTTLTATVRITGWSGSREAKHVLLAGALGDSNDDGVERVRPVERPVRAVDGGFVLALPPHSVSRLRLGAGRGLALAP